MPRKLALIIGNSHYQDPQLARLVAPGEDVADLTDVLRDAAIGGFDQVTPLINETDAAVRLSIEDFFADKKPDDLLVIYFSGHGVRDEQGQLFLAVNNTRANRLRATAIPAEFITREMDRSRSRRQVLILDCCHSGAFAQGSKAVTGESAGTGPTFEGSGYGRVVLTATDATQYAWEGDKIIGEADNSLFTHFVVEGLRSGSADTNGDGQITLDEMYDYVYEQVVTRTPKQTPGKWSYKQQGDIVIARNPRPVIKPAELPAEVRQLLEDTRPLVRETGVRELARLLHSDTPGLALAAWDALKALAEDDSLRVRAAAAQLLNTAAPSAPAVEVGHETAPRLPAVTPACVVVRGGPQAGRQFALQPGINVIGRGLGLEISLADDSSVSRRHAQIVSQGDRFTLEDLGSANGTFVNGQRVGTPHRLREGDVVSIGDTTLLFELKPIALPPVRTTAVSAPVTTSETILQSAAPADRARTKPIESGPRPIKRGWLIAGAITVLAIIVLAIVPALNSPAAKPGRVTTTVATTPTESATTGPAPTDQPQATLTPAPPFEPMSVSAADCTYGGLIKTIEAVDAYTVRFVLCTPDPAFALKLAYPTFGIQSAQHLMDTEGKPLDAPLGTGPYKLADWSRGDQITLVENSAYWGEAPLMPTVVIRWAESADARAAELQAGTVDGIDKPLADQVSRLQSDSTVKVYWRAGLNTLLIGLSNTQAPFDNEQVRRAMAVGIDRAAIIKQGYPDGATLADYVTPCEIATGCGGDAWYAYDPELAKALLAEAGYPDGFSVKLTYRDVVRSYLPSPQQVAEEIQRQLAELNIQVEVEVLESAQFLEASARGELAMFLIGWQADYPDPSVFLATNFGRDAGLRFGSQFDDVVAVLDQAAESGVAAHRTELFAEVNNLIRQHVPAIPVAHSGSPLAFRAAVDGVHASPMELEDFRTMQVSGQDTLTWLQATEPPSLYCADETNSDSLRVCAQIFDTLVRYEPGSTRLAPGLAEAWTASADATEWIFNLNSSAQFSNGMPLTANDVVLTLVAQWDAAHPLHTGNSGEFLYWFLFGNFLNQ